MNETANNGEAVQLGQGYFFQDLVVGARFKTWRRTITEADLVNFISVTGMLEVIFLEAAPMEPSGGIGGRPVPAALTYSIIEGFILQTMVQGTGMAMLEMSQKIYAPIRVGDSVEAFVEVTGIRPTSTGNRAIVDSEVSVMNQRGEKVMSYSARRMLAGRSAT